MVTHWRLLGAAVLVAVACRPAPDAPVELAQTGARLTASQRSYVDRIGRASDQRPGDFDRAKEAGLGMMWLALGGQLDLVAPAETYLERAFALNPKDEELGRTLGRFYNLRSVAGDWRKAEMQSRVYRAYLGDADPKALPTDRFIAYAFMRMGEALARANRGQDLAALRTVRELEGELADRVEADPDNIELQATAGNFAFFFAGNIPVGRRRRVREAVARFEIVRAGWAEMRPGARDWVRCPNTLENFMFELAEGHLVLGERERAAELYRELSRPRAPSTPAREQVAAASVHRLQYLDRYAGRMELMPPWPSDEGNCVVCHAHESRVPTRTFFHLEPVNWRVEMGESARG